MVQAGSPADRSRQPTPVEKIVAPVRGRESVAQKTSPVNQIQPPVQERQQATAGGVPHGTGASSQPGATGSGSESQGQAGGGTGSGSGAGSGSGSGSGIGSGSGSGSGVGQERQRERYLAEQFAYIKGIIQKHLIYPNRAKRDGLTGKVQIYFVVLENGTVSDIRVLKSSGYEILDANAVESIKRAAPFPRPPVRAELHMPVVYRLER